MSSGNLQADRRLEVALALKAGGDHEAAAGVVEQALELAPGWVEAWFMLGDLKEMAGSRAAAVAAYAACLARDPEDRMGAGLRLALLGAAPLPDAAPRAYVRTLFDQYAPRFEEALLSRLSYRAPYLLRDAVESLLPAEARWARALDIGCGTGLAGEAFRGGTAWLEGVDLSPRMIAAAGRKQLYDRLVAADALEFLATIADETYDFAVAADVVIYLGDLQPLFAGVARILRRGALFALTAQRGDGEGFLLGGDHRFWHAETYLRRVAAGAGFEIALLRDASCRTERGQDVPGLVCVLRRPGATETGRTGLPFDGHGGVPREPGSIPA